MLSVLATKPAVLTVDVPVMRMPFELMRKTLPLALRAPCSTLCSLPITRLRVIDEALGWLKLTVSEGAVLKLCQLMEALFVDWLMFVVVPDWPMAAAPVVTTPP